MALSKSPPEDYRDKATRKRHGQLGYNFSREVFCKSVKLRLYATEVGLAERSHVSIWS